VSDIGKTLKSLIKVLCNIQFGIAEISQRNLDETLEAGDLDRMRQLLEERPVIQESIDKIIDELGRG
jgi:hypothetical protein